MYPVEIIPERYRFIFSFNPMSVIINAYREVIIGQGKPNLNSLSLAFLVSLSVFVIGFLIFKKLEGKFADYV